MKTYADGFNKKFDSALDKLITEFRTGIAGIRTDNQVANQYLKLLNQKSEEIIAAINELQNASKGSGMTLAEFEAYMNERDAAQYEKYKALIEALGIKLDKGNATLDDLLKAINAWKADQKDYTAQLNAILDKLDGINWSNPDYSSKLDKIIELLTEFKCNCSCTGNSNSNEGIIEDLDNLLS
jgi:chromosome segregation ATPase